MYPSGAQTINAGNFFGLLNVQYTVASSAVGGSSGTLGIGPDTLLAQADGTVDGFTTPSGGGSITISSIPEPSAVILLAIGCGAVVVGSARGRRVRVGSNH